MSRFLTIIFIFKTLPFVGQTFTSDNRNSWKGKFGNFIPLTSDYKNPIETTFQSQFNSPKQFVGLSLEHPRGYGKRNICAEVGINYFINQTKNIGDTLKLNWFANNFYWLFKYDLFPQNKYVDLFICAGGLVGSQRIIVDNKSSQVYKNFNACVVPQIELRIQTIKRISVGIETNFLYDLTSKKWKNHPNSYYLDNSKFTGTTINIFVGWCWGK